MWLVRKMIMGIKDSVTEGISGKEVRKEFGARDPSTGKQLANTKSSFFPFLWPLSRHPYVSLGKEPGQ